MRKLAVILLVVVGLVIITSWINIVQPFCNETNTMVYKLKYVRLRPIHEEEWKAFRNKMKAADLDSRARALKENLPNAVAN